MNKKNIRNISIDPSYSIRDAMKKMTEAHMGVLPILNADRSLFGIVVDGDIRRALINGANIDDSITEVANKTPVSCNISASDSDLIYLMKSSNKTCIPIIDKNKEFICIKYYEDLTSVKKISNRAVILAGGFGKRLMPYTSKVPKPMLKVGGKPLIEKILDGLIKEGICNISLLLHYKPEIFTKYFSGKKYYEDLLDFIIEREPRGTAGGLYGIAEKINESFLVLNGDNIVSAKWKKVIEDHNRKNNIITIGASEYITDVPFGVLEIDQNKVIGITEKPIQSWLTVCSAYCISPEAIKYIPKTGIFNMPDLINCVLKEKGKIGYFRVNEYQRIEDLAPSHKVIWDDQ
jgi:dTDP-glucose pyrophosphorylase